MSDTIRIDKKLFVISDLHFGDFSSRDNFHTGLKVGNSEYDREKQFYAFLDHVESQDGRLLILGDIFEFWQSNIGTVISKNKKMLDRLAAMDIHAILGNHDADIFELIQDEAIGFKHPFFSKIYAPNDYCTKSKSGRDETLRIMTASLNDDMQSIIGFIHGHEVDVYNRSSIPGIGRIVTIAAGFFEDSCGSPYSEEPPFSGALIEGKLFDLYEDLIKGMKEIMQNSTNSWFMETFFPTMYEIFTKKEFIAAQFYKDEKEEIRLAIEVLRKGVAHKAKDGENETSMQFLGLNENSILVAGHTHADALESFYCNSGSWITAKPSYLVISQNGEIELYRWNATGNSTGESISRGIRTIDGRVKIFESFGRYNENWVKKYPNSHRIDDGVYVDSL